MEDPAGLWQLPGDAGSDQVDAVYISLPNHLHAEWTVHALQAGKHVLCEKPFAISLEEVDQMIAASRQTGRCLAEAFMYLHHPQMAVVKEWVDGGRLGEITLVRGVFNFKMDNLENVRLEPAYGGGCLWDVGVYPLSFAQYVFGGLPESVFGWQWVGPSSVDEVFVGQMRYPGGELAQISSSFRSPFYTYAEVIGSEGRLALDRPFTMNDRPSRMMFFGAQDEVEQVRIPKAPNYLGEIEDMNNAILHGTPLRLTLDEDAQSCKDGAGAV